METPLEDGSVRTDEHKVRNALYTVDVSWDLTAVVDVEPVHSELCSSIDSVRLRLSLPYCKAIRKAKKAIRKAFENSMNGKGSNLVEIVSTCNSGWKMTPAASNKWMEENMFPFYQLGDLKDKE